MNKKNPSCSVIIVTHNSELYIHKTMECLHHQTVLADHVVLVDSGSADLTYLSRYSNQPNVDVVAASKDIGFCKGNNIGLSKISEKCDYVFFLNPDAFLTPDYLEKAMTFMEKPENHQYGALTGTLLGYDIHKDQPTGNYDSTGVFQRWYGHWYDRRQGMKYCFGHYQNPENVPAICGAALFCRKKALDSVLIRNGEIFDNAFFMYKEDIDLSIRLRRQRWKLVFLPDLMAYHCRGWQRDRSKMPRQMRLISARNELKIHMRLYSPVKIVYSFLKYATVKCLDI
jgi:N-acetylglucosaminyl-diphospho-decaprenol L-rhamnosyltransferase